MTVPDSFSNACAPASKGLLFSRMVIEKATQTVFTPLEDTTAVLLNVKTLAYYKLNHTGAVIWQEVEKWQVLAFDDLLRAVCETLSVSEDEARPYLHQFVASLEGLNFIQTS